MIIKVRLAPLGAISRPEGELARRKSAFYVAPNGADRVFYLRIYKDVAPTEPGPLVPGLQRGYFWPADRVKPLMVVTAVVPIRKITGSGFLISMRTGNR